MCIRDRLFADGKANRHSVGQSCAKVAELAGIEIPAETRVIVAVADGTGATDSLGGEKMAPVLSAYAYKDLDDAIRIARCV